MTNPPDPFEFVKQLWGQMAVPGFGLTGNAGGAGSVPGMPGLQMPSFDPKELEKRLAELKQVKQWLEMNLHMMGLQINTLEMQLAAINGLQAASTKVFGDQATKNVGGSASQADSHAENAPGTAGKPPDAPGTPGAQWMDPQGWMKFMQDQATKTQKAIQDGAQAMQHAGQFSPKPAPKPAPKSTQRSAAAPATAKRAPRKRGA